MPNNEALKAGGADAPGEYVPVPVAAARAIAEQYGKSIVIIFAHDPIHGLLHTTTYGTDEQNRAWAAQGGEIATKALGGLREAIDFEDYRLDRIKDLYEACCFVKSFLTKLEDGAEPGDPLRDIRRKFHAPLHAVLDAALAKAHGESDAK